MIADLILQPDPGPHYTGWRALIERPLDGSLLGHTLGEWRARTRQQLGLEVDRPIIATGHQTLLWHPGILAKYLAMEAAAKSDPEATYATANLVVDQHVDHFGAFDVPIRRADGSLGVKSIQLGPVRTGEAMGYHPPLWTADPPQVNYAHDCVKSGVDRIIAAVRAERGQANAAMQMALALAELMRPWVRPTPNVTTIALMTTGLARAMLEHMADDPERCVNAYNRAVAAVPEAGIGPLRVDGSSIELPLWRIGEDGRRVRAFDHDVAIMLDSPLGSDVNFDFMPRALFMTALVRLGMCDLFIHGTGGARYDRAMELWVGEWLGVEPAPIAIATATLQLPLMDEEVEAMDVEAARHAARHVWHDPELVDGLSAPTRSKKQLLHAMDLHPHGSAQRRAAFFDMHKQLDALRHARREHVESAQRVAVDAERAAIDAAIAGRRDWAFPLYPNAMLDELAEQIGARTKVRR